MRQRRTEVLLSKYGIQASGMRTRAIATALKPAFHLGFDFRTKPILSGPADFTDSGNGTPQHVAAELFKRMAGVEMIHAPCRGSGPALADLIGGQVRVMIDAMPSAIEHVRRGRVRALAVTTPARADKR